MPLKARRITFRLDRYDEERLIKLRGWRYKYEVSEIIRLALQLALEQKDAEQAAEPKDLATLLSDDRSKTWRDQPPPKKPRGKDAAGK